MNEDEYSDFRNINNMESLSEEQKIETMAQVLSVYSKEQLDLIQPSKVTMLSPKDISLGRLLTIAKGRAQMYQTGVSPVITSESIKSKK